MAETWNRRTPPADMALVPREITAESGHKTGMIGDFKTSIEVECSQCDTDDPYSQCDECGGQVFYRHEVAVSWPTIKAIHRRIIELSEVGNE
ncbi:MAG: hypothetical protein GYB54_02590 [Gammaproteobacteria bacterium]|nr:hypothetical protein [Gammaproteobacteria bacterium]